MVFNQRDEVVGEALHLFGVGKNKKYVEWILSGSKWIRLLPGILTAIVGRYDVFGDRTFILDGHTQSPSGSEWIRPVLSESERIWNVDCDCRPLRCLWR